LSPEFNADSAYTYIEKQLSFGHRIPNQPAHKKCAAWMVEKFKSLGCEVSIQNATVTAYDGTKLQIQNIIAATNPKATRRMMVAAHWDSRPWADQDPDPAKHKTPILAANDAGSGVAVMMEMARVMQAKNPEIGVDFFLWDAEDYGKGEVENSFCLGSQHWARNKHKKDYKAELGFNLDMVGADGAVFYGDQKSIKGAGYSTKKLWEIGNEIGYGNLFSYVESPALIDDYIYVMEIGGVPTTEVIDRRLNSTTGDFDFCPTWHTMKDDLSGISKTTLKAVGQVLLEFVYREKPAS
ncbi:MAG: M28 family peptidase, partial [Bacteroidia bacterium]